MTKQTEAALQRTVVQYLSYALPRHEVLFWHTPNGGLRSRATAGRLKAEGVVPGVADIIIVWAGRCIAIELKAKGGSQSPAQKAWADQFTTAGGVYVVCRSLDAVERFLDAAGIPLRASVGGHVMRKHLTNTAAFDAFEAFNNSPRWVAWKNETKGNYETKVPYWSGGRASCSDPSTWLMRADAAALCARAGYVGIGIQLGDLGEGLYLIGLDLDTCRDKHTGETTTWADDAIACLGSYAEVSPSGTGYKVFALATEETLAAIRPFLTKGGAVTFKGGSGKHPPAIDLYTANRYFTVTGLQYEWGGDAIAYVSAAQLQRLLCEIGPGMSGKQDRLTQPRSAAGEALAFSEATGPSEVPDGPAALLRLQHWARELPSEWRADVERLLVDGIVPDGFDPSNSGVEFFLASQCKRAGFSEAEFNAAADAFENEGHGYANRRDIGTKARDRGRVWANSRGEAKSGGAGSDAWPDPEQLDVDEGAPTMFPLEALPPVMRDAVGDISSALSCNTALAAAGILAAANLAVQDHFDVEFQGGRYRPLSLFLISVAVSGERKSTVDAYTLEGMTDFVKEDVRLWKERQGEIEAVRNGNKGKKPAQREEEPSPLPDPHIIANYGSVQGLFRAFHEGKSSLGLFSDEGGQFLGGHSLGKMENRLHGLASLSKLWDGGTQVTRLRGQDKVSEVLAADDPRLAVHLQAQPIAVQPFLDDRMAKGQGVLARFLVHKPASTIGTRITSVERWAASNRTDAVVRFNDRVKECLSRPHERREDGSIRRYGLRMPRAAQQVLVDYFNSIERQLAPGGTLEGMSDLANKNHENAARIAGTLAAFDGRDGVDAQDMKAGSEIASYFLSEAIRLARLAPQEEGVQDALAIARWLHERGGRVSNTDLNNGLPNHLRRKKARAKPMALLQEAGWIRQVGKAWELNPLCVERGWV